MARCRLNVAALPTCRSPSIQGFVLAQVTVANIHIVPVFACLPVVSVPWIQANQAWVIAVVVIVGTVLLGLLTWTFCFRNTRPAVVQVPDFMD